MNSRWRSGPFAPLTWWQRWLSLNFPEPYQLGAGSFRFRDPEFERRFFREYEIEPARFSSLAIGTGLIMYLLFGILDWILFPEVLRTVWAIRFGIGTPILVLAFVLTRRPASQIHQERLMFVTVQVTALSIIAIMQVAPPPLSWLYFSGLLLILIFNYNFMRMRFWMAVASGWMMLPCLLLIELLYNRTPPGVIAVYIFMFVTASIPAMAGTFISELFARKSFVQSRLFDNLANTDELTGLPNRRHILARLRSEINRSQRYRRPLALAIIDVDHFKRVNDQHGHLIGDKVLQAITARLLHAIRISDIAGRLGGEEFAVILPETNDKNGARMACERIRKRIAHAPIPVDSDTAVSISISVGVVYAAPVEVDLDGLVRQADDALYEAKAKGRNRVVAVRQH